MNRMTNFRSAAIATGNAIDGSAYDNVKKVADNISDVNNISSDINNINKVAGISPDVTTVAGISPDVTIVANSNTAITNINAQVVPNIAKILVADSNAATATAQASIATTKANEASVSATNAAASEAITNANVIAATDQANIATTQATNATNSATSASNSATTATTKATVATTEATNASNSANAASISKANAATSATNAATSANNAKTSETNAATSATSATNSMNSASTSQTTAYNWATYTVDSPVPEGNGTEYSARHWANKAALAATGSLKYKGTWNATTPFPTTPALGDYYKVTTAGPETVGPYTYNPGDAIIYNGTSWDIIDGSDKVSSVDGQLGNVNLSASYEPKNLNIQSHISNTGNPHSVTKAQVGLGNVNNTSDANKPVSTATQTALNSKQAVLSEGAFINGDKTKLDGIEVGATADQTGTEIKTLYEAQANTNAYTDLEKVVNNKINNYETK